MQPSQQRLKGLPDFSPPPDPLLRPSLRSMAVPAHPPPRQARLQQVPLQQGWLRQVPRRRSSSNARHIPSSRSTGHLAPAGPAERWAQATAAAGRGAGAWQQDAGGSNRGGGAAVPPPAGAAAAGGGGGGAVTGPWRQGAAAGQPSSQRPPQVGRRRHRWGATDGGWLRTVGACGSSSLCLQCCMSLANFHLLGIAPVGRCFDGCVFLVTGFSDAPDAKRAVLRALREGGATVADAVPDPPAAQVRGGGCGFCRALGRRVRPDCICDSTLRSWRCLPLTSSPAHVFLYVQAATAGRRQSAGARQLALQPTITAVVSDRRIRTPK